MCSNEIIAVPSYIPRAYRLQGELRGHTTVYVAKFKPRLKMVTVLTVNIGAKAAKVANIIVTLTIAFGVTCPLLLRVYEILSNTCNVHLQ